MKIILPIVVTVIEEAIKLIMEAMNDESLDKKEKVKYILNGLTCKIDNILEK